MLLFPELHYNFENLNVPEYFIDCLLTADTFRQHNLRSDYQHQQSNLLYFRFPKLMTTCKSIKIAAACLWNQLPQNITSINNSKNIFKNEVRKWFISQY